MLNENGQIHIKEVVILREEDDGAFLFDPDSGRICYLNEIGTMVWRLCQKNSIPGQLVDLICSDFPEISREQISQDCMQFLMELQRLEFLSINA
ncbi:MAG: PqqD family protein [bacterium]